MLATVVDAAIRGTAVSVFFFFITIFGVLAPHAYDAVRRHYDLDPIEEPREFGIFVCLCTVIPCILAIPCFYIAGVKYSWFKYHQAMFELDIWGEFEQLQEDDISKKRWYQAQLRGGPDPGDPTSLSMSVDWKAMRQERKIKVKELKRQNLDLKEVRPLMRRRAARVGEHKHKIDENDLRKQKTIIASFNEDQSL